MLDALTDRTRVTTAGLLRVKQHDAGVGHERRSAAEPFPLWLSASYVIHILPLKTEVKHRVPCSPARDCPFELEITFCVRGVKGPPCGVPSSTALTSPFSITPDSRMARINLSILLSLPAALSLPSACRGSLDRKTFP